MIRHVRTQSVLPYWSTVLTKHSISLDSKDSWGTHEQLVIYFAGRTKTSFCLAFRKVN